MYSCYSHYSNSNIVKSGPGFQTVIRIEDQKIFSKCTKGIPYCCQKYQYRKVTQSSCDVKMMTLSLFILRKKFQGLRALYASLSLIEKKKEKTGAVFSISTFCTFCPVFLSHSCLPPLCPGSHYCFGKYFIGFNITCQPPPRSCASRG